MTFGEKITYFRNRKGWSSGQLSEESGVSRGYLWQLETGGKDKPSLEVIERLARALEVSVADFVEEESKAPPVSQPLPPGLALFVREKSGKYGITKSDIEMLRSIHYRGKQPVQSDDWDLLYLFLRKLMG
jgi:transcriptional regulator with XRE-family HTH domain